MVAVLQLLLSDQPPEVPRKAGLGDRFHYFRGGSRRRYLFSEVPARDLADFTSAVAVVAERRPEGRLAVTSIAALDAFGKPAIAHWRGPRIPAGAVTLVHLLTTGAAERDAMIADLLSAAAAPAPAGASNSALALAA